MNKKTFFKRTMGMTLGVATLLGTGIMAGTALAADPTPTNDITITAPAFTPANFNAPTINGRQFTATQFAKYTDVQVKDGVITGYDLVYANGYNDTNIMPAIEAAIVTGTGSSATVKDGFTSVASLDNGTLKFVGEAENLTPLQFVGKYFYGDGNDTYGNDRANSEEVHLFAAYLQAHKPAGTTDITATGENNQVVFDVNNDNEGLYLITEDASKVPTADTQKETITRAMIVGSGYTDNGTTITKGKNADGNEYTLGSLKLKAESVTVEKNSDNVLTTQGDTVPFTITTNVPNYTEFGDEYQTPSFYITDNPSDNLQVDTNNISVKVSNFDGTGETPLELNTNYSLDKTNGDSADPNDFKITLKNPKDYSGKKVVVTYNTTVTGLPSVTDGITNNHVEVTFSNNPTNGSATATINTDERVYDALLDFQKVKFNDAATKLMGAQFDVTGPDGNPLKLIKNANGTEYTIAEPQTSTGSTLTSTMTVMANVNDTPTPVAIRGLAANLTNGESATYTFTESKAPAGYVLGQNPVTFTVTVTPQFDTDGEVTGVNYKVASAAHENFIDLTGDNLTTSEGNTVNVATDVASTTVLNGGTVTIENTTNLQDFAKTGGDILTMVGIAAGLLVAGAGALAVARRRNAKAQA